MTILVSDTQVVGETVSTLFSVLQQGPVAMTLIIKNSGVNTINYRFQEWNGTTWADIGANGTDYYNTLIQNQVRSFKVESSYPQIRLVGNASGGAFLEFSVLRYADRASGGSIPILAL